MSHEGPLIRDAVEHCIRRRLNESNGDFTARKYHWRKAAAQCIEDRRNGFDRLAPDPDRPAIATMCGIVAAYNRMLHKSIRQSMTAECV